MLPFGQNADSVQPPDAEVALPVSIVAEAAVATFAAVVFVHLFAGPIDPLGEFLAHALLITTAYTAAFAVIYLVLQRLRAIAFVRGASTPVLVAVLSAVACLAGAVVLGKLRDVGGALGGVVDVHDDANWLLKLLPVWAVMTVVLYQWERTRLLESELRRLSVSRTRLKAQDTGPVPPSRSTEHMVEIGTGKVATALPAGDVAYIMAVENYCEVHFTESAARKPVLVRATLASVVGQLPADFVRVHRSYVVNLACVDSIGKAGRAYAALLSDGSSVPVSRSNADDVSARWRDFLKAEPTNCDAPS